MAGRWRKQLPPRRSPSTSSVQELPSQARFEGDGLSASAQPSPAARSVIARLGESSKSSQVVSCRQRQNAIALSKDARSASSVLRRLALEAAPNAESASPRPAVHPGIEVSLDKDE